MPLEANPDALRNLASKLSETDHSVRSILAHVLGLVEGLISRTESWQGNSASEILPIVREDLNKAQTAAGTLAEFANVVSWLAGMMDEILSLRQQANAAWEQIAFVQRNSVPGVDIGRMEAESHATLLTAKSEALAVEADKQGVYKLSEIQIHEVTTLKHWAGPFLETVTNSMAAHRGPYTILDKHRGMTFGEMNTGIVPYDPYAPPAKPLPNGGLSAREINRFEIMFGGTPDEIMGQPDGNLGSSLLIAGGAVLTAALATTVEIWGPPLLALGSSVLGLRSATPSVEVSEESSEAGVVAQDVPEGTGNAVLKEVDGQQYKLIGDNPVAKYSNGQLSRINTDLSGGQSKAENIFNDVAKGNRVVTQTRGGTTIKTIFGSNGDRLMQLRVAGGKVNLDVWQNGVYEDIHFSK